MMKVGNWDAMKAEYLASCWVALKAVKTAMSSAAAMGLQTAEQKGFQKVGLRGDWMAAWKDEHLAAAKDSRWVE